MREIRVLVEAWAQECCGDPIVVGAKVRWTVTACAEPSSWTIFEERFASTITHTQEHHGVGLHAARDTVGVVTAIRVVFCRYVASTHDARFFTPIPGSGVVHEAVAVTRSEDPPDDLSLVGYVVDLRLS